MYHTHRVKSKKQRTKAQRQNRSKVQKRSTPPEPRQKPPTQPPKLDIENVKDALALYIHNSIKINEQQKKFRRRNPLFSRSHPSLFDARDTRSTTTIPTVPEIRNYVRDIIDRRRLSAETVVVSVVLLTRTGVRIKSSNWARLLLVAFLLANKEAEDVYNVWNVRFFGIIPDLPLYEINLLEMEFLKLIKYRLHVEPNTFREYSDRLGEFLEEIEKNDPENGISENLEIINPEIPDQITPKNVKKGKKIENGLDELQKQIFSKIDLATSGEVVKVLLKSPLLVKYPLLVKSPLRPT